MVKGQLYGMATGNLSQDWSASIFYELNLQFCKLTIPSGEKLNEEEIMKIIKLN